MRKNFLPVIILIITVATFLQSCNKDIPTGMSIQPYTFKSLDENGGTWKPVLLTDGSEVGVSAPAEVSSAAYQSELSDLKATISNLTDDQKTAVEYWGSNSLIRWNEIASELAAKYNMPPTPNPDGTYPAPDAANPGNYPYFPFAHPQYTSRMYAYWSGAQFDALISVWHEKYTYNRVAPYKADAAIQTLLPENDLPGYPSEDAAIAAVSEVILSAMFPLEKDYIISKSLELKNARMWAGMNVSSDIAAGDSLGRAVAAKFIDRAKTDGMKNAQTPKPISDSIKNAAIVNFGWSWKNLETPERPVGLTPLFSKVKPWFIPGVEAVRPPAPPAPGSAAFLTATDELKGYMKNLTKEEADIAYFWADGPGTYTPPGHWNRFAKEYIVQDQLNPLRTARVYAYLNMAMEDAGISCFDSKYYYHYPRPSGADESITTIIGIPSFPSYTSGHATFSGAGCSVLSYFFPDGSSQFQEWAKDATESRIYARIHYRFDCEVGLTTGIAIGDYAVDAAKADGAN
ncbi:MAG: phosphatase PAP2 family protein [Chitinophagaceae bacterium]|nr:phosphatase PAP2 family protein [Chitinophagaceae bacterium]